MEQNILEIKNLWARCEEKEILKGVNLTIKSGEIHCIMGPNGTGKSTLSSVIMGDPRYEVTDGEVLLNGENILEMSVDQRAKAGIFLAMQYPSEIAGITNRDFIRHAQQATGNAQNLYQYIKSLDQAVSDLEMNPNMLERYVNEGFSGGEKKRNEILQMKMLKPKVSILDEIDSGLDIDALRIVGKNLEDLIKENPQMSYLIITHYQRLLDYVKPTHVHVMLDGRIVESGDMNLALELETNGYDAMKQKYNIVDNKEDDKQQLKNVGCINHGQF